MIACYCWRIEFQSKNIRDKEIGGETSLRTYSPTLILIVVAIADMQRWADPDLWGHLAFGRAMLASGHLTLHDPYSYSAPGHLWLNHEWLSEAMMAAIYNGLGVIGLKLMKFACCGAVFGFLALGLAETKSPAQIQFAILLIAAVAIGPQIQFRPQLFTFAMLSALLAILARFNYRGRAPVWLAIAMLALWANLHGGFIIGIATLIIFSAVVLCDDLYIGRGNRRGIWLFSITAMATIATLATPYGSGTWRAVAHALANPHTGAVIDDWQSLPRSLVTMWHLNHVGAIPMILALAMFVSLAATFAMSPRGDDLPMVAIAFVMIVAAFLAMRNLPIAIIATVIPLARHSPLAFKIASDSGGRSSWIAQAAIAIAAFALLLATGLLSDTLRAGDPRPVGAIAFMKQHQLSGNLMADFGWGEYVIWHMAPASKVFIDGRYDTVYPASVIDDYLAFNYGKAGAKDFLTKYPHDFILLSLNDKAALEEISRVPAWMQLYRDANCILFARADSAAAKIPSATISAEETPKSFFP